MGKNFDTDAERRTIDMWVCKTCGRSWPVNGQDSNWTAADAEMAARTCCSENSWCFVCGERRTRYPHRACETCDARLNRERWEACEVRPLEFPLTLQDVDRWFHNEDELIDYCEEYGLHEADLLLRIGKRVVPRYFEPSGFWADAIPEGDDLAEDRESDELANKINAWAKENIIAYEMGPFRPELNSENKESKT